MASLCIHPLSEPNWQPASAADFSFPGGTDLWLIDTSLHKGLPEGIVTQDELRGGSRFRNAADRERFITAKAALRTISAKYLGCEPSVLPYAEMENKKPYWQPPFDWLHFNTTHSGKYILIAFSVERVGADIERVNKAFAYEGLLERCFDTAETDLIRTARNPPAMFFLLWTRKEALVKRNGEGLHDQLPGLPSLEGMHTIDGQLLNFSVNAHLYSFKIGEEYFGSVVSVFPHQQVRFFQAGELSL